MLRLLFAQPGGGRLDEPILHGFSLALRDRMRMLGIHFHYETLAEWEARMQLARSTGCQQPGQPCDKSRAQCIAEKIYRDELVTFAALSTKQIQMLLDE